MCVVCVYTVLAYFNMCLLRWCCAVTWVFLVSGGLKAPLGCFAPDIVVVVVCAPSGDSAGLLRHGGEASRICDSGGFGINCPLEKFHESPGSL